MPDGAALQGIRILDFTWVLAGPYATRLLADFGAEVIKVQPLLAEGDDTFARGYYSTWNRNKLGITLDLNDSEGIAIARRLVATSDAVVENFAPRVMDNLGLDYESLRKVRPDLIMVSMSAMGQTGPWRNYAGFGPAVHAFSGMTQLTAYPGGPPLGPGFAYADHVAGLFASLALLSALEQREATGQGEHVDVSQTEAMTALLGRAILECDMTGHSARPAGNQSPDAAPHGVYRCKGRDRWCAIVVSTEQEWQALKQALGNPRWAEESRFSSLAGRLSNRDELDALITGWTLSRTAYDVMSFLQSQGVSAGVVQDARDLVNDPQLKSRDFFVRLGDTIADAAAVRLSATPATYLRAAPAPGQDNDYVYRKLLGMSQAEVARLRDRGTI